MDADTLRAWADQFEAAVNARFESAPLARSSYFAIMRLLRAGRKCVDEFDAGSWWPGKLIPAYRLFKDAQAEFGRGAGRDVQFRLRGAAVTSSTTTSVSG